MAPHVGTTDAFSRSCSLAGVDSFDFRPQGKIFQQNENDDDDSMHRTKSLPSSKINKLAADTQHTSTIPEFSFNSKPGLFLGTKGSHVKANFSIDWSTRQERTRRLQVDHDVTVKNVASLGQVDFCALPLPSSSRTLTAEEANALSQPTLRCPSCNKANAPCLTVCSSCGSSALVEEGRRELAPNVMSRFCVGRAPCPLVWSDPEFLVIDENSPKSDLHLMALPTKALLPDWRYLLQRPKAGLRLLKDMERRLAHAILLRKDAREERNQPCGPLELFRHASARRLGMQKDPDERLVRAGDKEVSAHSFPQGALSFSWPPSMNHLHLSFAAAPWLPKKAALLERGRGQEGTGVLDLYRHWPLVYVEEILERAAASADDGAEPAWFGSMLELGDGRELAAFFEKKFGVSYELVHAAYIEGIVAANQEGARYVWERDVQLAPMQRYLGPAASECTKKSVDEGVEKAVGPAREKAVPEPLQSGATGVPPESATLLRAFVAKPWHERYGHGGLRA